MIITLSFQNSGHLHRPLETIDRLAKGRWIKKKPQQGAWGARAGLLIVETTTHPLITDTTIN
jgi:hypothetical protein